jgi:hypothetical protein
MFVNETAESGVIGVSCPGGMARQFRVQITTGEFPVRWNLAGSFRDRREAGNCAARLTMAGYQTRIVDCRTLPTAA